MYVTDPVELPLGQTSTISQQRPPIHTGREEQADIEEEIHSGTVLWT